MWHMSSEVHNSCSVLAVTGDRDQLRDEIRAAVSDQVAARDRLGRAIRAARAAGEQWPTIGGWVTGAPGPVERRVWNRIWMQQNRWEDRQAERDGAPD